MTQPIYRDPDYVQGQIVALQALILGLAKDKTTWLTCPKCNKDVIKIA